MSIELTLLARVSYRGREITGPRLCGLLALLATDLRTGCGTARLVSGLWPDEQPESPTKALQVLVSRVRAQLGAEVIARTPTGYRLALAEDQVDTSAVLLSVAASGQQADLGDHEAALVNAEAGLALWLGAEDGDPGLADPLSVLRAQRASTFRSLARARALALARLGRQAEAVPPLTEALRAQPRDEEVLLELLRAEAATLGPGAALARYEGYRRVLRAELGTDPGPALRAVHQRLLQGEQAVLRHGVPHEPNALLGREADIASVAKLLRTSRVTSIVGVGGLGKTRLAHVVSRQAEHRVVHFVALAGVAADDDVAGEVAAVLGVGESPSAAAGTDVVTGIVNALGSGPVLVVLDNCEQVLRGVAELVRTLVSMTREVRVLTTSRAPLGLSSESVYPLPELTLDTAIALFEQRARAARPGVGLSGDTVAELCRHLDGLPLAVELAAARVRVLSVAEIARRLADRFALLRGGSRDAPQRHHNLHAVVDWSWQLVEPAGQAAMRLLSVFPGGFTEDAARTLLREADILRVLEQLVDQSLLKVTDTPSGTRFRMLETVREFSVAHRDAAGEQDRAVDGFLAWARACGLRWHALPFGAEPASATARIRDEQDNLVLALRLGLARAEGATVVAVAAALGALWMIEANYLRLTTMAGDIAWVLAHFRPDPEFVEVLRAAATLCTADTFAIQGPRAVRSLLVLRRLPPAPPDTVLRAIAIVLAAVPEIQGPDHPALVSLCDSEAPLLAGAASSVASYLWEQVGDLDRALAAAERMLAAAERRMAPWVWAMAHARIGELCTQAQLGAKARRHFLAALPVLARFGEYSHLGAIRWSLAMACLQIGAVDEAEHWLAQTTLHRSVDPDRLDQSVPGVRAEILLARGEVEPGLAQWRRTVDLLGNAENLESWLEEPALNPWVLENQAAAVIAHARHGRADLVAGIVADLPDLLATTLANPSAKPPIYVKEILVCGALLLAIGMVDLDRGTRTADRRLIGSGVRLVALAERFGFLRNFQPSMSASQARRAAETADESAYSAAVVEYADSDHAQLRAAALVALRTRAELTGY